nr:flavin reductase [Hartmannibacter diazotrophicus]
MARVASAVHVITTDGPAGRAGMTATAVSSVTDTPPTLLVCVKRTTAAYPALVANGQFCVNTLAADMEAVAAAFGGKTAMDERFAAGDWYDLATGSPALVGALSSFACRVTARHSVGTHDVFYGEVVAIGLGQPSGGLSYFARGYRTLAP